MAKLTHFDAQGHAHMVDVSQKDVTTRTAIARGEIHMSRDTLSLVQDGRAKKGDVLGVARLAGIMAAKKTSDMIPLCHPLALSKVTLELTPAPELPGIRIESTVKTAGQTGVEMEALCAVSTAALTVYDMLKAAQKTMEIQNIRLVHKDGGASGVFSALSPATGEGQK